MKRIVVGLSGATGQILGIRLLEALNKVPDVEVHLVVSEWAERTISMETDYTIEQVRALADVCYSCKNVGASIASGSFKHDGMIVMPCSMKTLAAISAGFTSELVSRAADVALKERRKLKRRQKQQLQQQRRKLQQRKQHQTSRLQSQSGISQ